VLRVEVLSGFRLSDLSGKEFPVSALKARALMAYLCMSPDRLHRRERLACLLWDGAGDRAARQSLRKCLSALRAALGPAGPAALAFDGDRIGVRRDAIECDVTAFRDYAAAGESEAAAAMVGDDELLHGIDVETEPFREWLRDERLRHAAMVDDVLYAAAEKLARRGALEPAIRTTRRLLARDACCEEAHRLLIALLHRVGRPAAARRQYALCAQRLEEELGVSTSPETRAAAFAAARRFAPVCGIADTRIVVPDFAWTGIATAGESLARHLRAELVAALSRYRRISVVPQDASAHYVVDGTLQLARARSRLVVRLASGIGGDAIWSDRLELDSRALPDAGGDLVYAAVSRLVAAIDDHARRRPTGPAGAPSPADLVHRGYEHFFRYTRRDSTRAAALFERAIAAEPDCGPAYAGLALVYQFDAFFKYCASPQDALARGLEMARAAIAIDRLDARAHQSLGKVLTRMGDFDGATVALETALSLCPSLEGAEYALGLAHYYRGSQEAALDRFGRAHRLNPHGPLGWAVRHLIARCHFDRGRVDDALTWACAAVNAPHAKSIAFAMKAVAAARTGHEGLARREVSEIVRRDPRMTASFLVSTFGNEFLAGPIESMAETLRRIGLPH